MDIFVWGSYKTGLVLGVFSMHFRFFWGHHKTRLVLGIISMHFRVFPYDQGTKWGNFAGLLKF